MKGERRLVRRRKWKRFETKGGAVVLLNRPYFNGWLGIKRVEMGPIVNISMGGLAVQYVENKKRVGDYAEMSIYAPGDGIALDRLPFDIISDYEVARMPDGKIIRNRCVKFGPLTTYQTFQLEQFIKNHGAKCMEDRRQGADRRKFIDPRYGDDAYKDTFIERRSGVDRRERS